MKYLNEQNPGDRLYDIETESGYIRVYAKGRNAAVNAATANGYVVKSAMVVLDED